jgi:hypothetical protein
MRTPNFRFSGSPQAIAAAGQATQAHYAAQAARAQAAGQTGSAFHNAAGQVRSAAMEQPGIFAGTLSDNYGNYSQGMSGAYQGYAGAMGNAFNAMANQSGSMYGANAMAEAARMGALGNIGSAGLGAYGSSTNAAMDAWARNQQAYNQSAATMHMANQSGLSNFGAADVNARSRAAIAASLMGGMGGGMDGTFSADGLGGPVASGSFSGSGGGYGGGRGGGGGGINSTMQAELARQSDAGRAQLDNQHYSSRGMPSQMMDQGLAGLMALSGQSMGAIGQGMNQFYGNQQQAGNQSDMNSVLAGLSRQLRSTQGDLTSGMGDSNNRIEGLFNNSLGNLQMFQSPAEITRRAIAGQMARR